MVFVYGGVDQKRNLLNSLEWLSLEGSTNWLGKKKKASWKSQKLKDFRARSDPLMAATSAEYIVLYGGLGKDGQPLTDGILLDS